MASLLMNRLINRFKTCKLKYGRILHTQSIFQVAKSSLKKVTKCLSKNAQTDDASKVKELDTITQKIKLLSPRYLITKEDNGNRLAINWLLFTKILKYI